MVPMPSADLGALERGELMVDGPILGRVFILLAEREEYIRAPIEREVSVADYVCDFCGHSARAAAPAEDYVTCGECGDLVIPYARYSVFAPDL